jgi:membrane-associated phospholipid phosphatase
VSATDARNTIGQRVILPKGWLDVWCQLLLVIASALAYELIRAAVRGDGDTALAHAYSVVRLERMLGLFVELDIQRWVLRGPTVLVSVSNWTYITTHFAMTVSVLVWVYLRRHSDYATLRNTLLTANGIGLVGYLVYPLAPPRMLPQLGFVDTLGLASISHESGPIAALSNPYAAMPSLHTTYALIIGGTAAVLVRSNWCRMGWTLYPAIIVFSIVVTGNHYVLDAIAGAAVAALALILVVAFTQLGRRRRTPHRHPRSMTSVWDRRDSPGLGAVARVFTGRHDRRRGARRVRAPRRAPERSVGIAGDRCPFSDPRRD